MSPLSLEEQAEVTHKDDSADEESESVVKMALETANGLWDDAMELMGNESEDHNNTEHRKLTITTDIDTFLAEMKDKRSNMVSYLHSLLSQLRESISVFFLSRSSVH